MHESEEMFIKTRRLKGEAGLAVVGAGTVGRALGVIRLSVGSVGQTGDDTQRRRIRKRIDADELELVGWAEDIDVSASLSPWLRPQLGDWLNNLLDDFDVLYVYKIDRIARSVKDLCALLDWCDEHGKSLVSIEEGFDLSTSWGRTIAKILAVLAEAELEAIRARVRASREALRAAGRWPGGLVPFGRVAVKDGDGYTLRLDPVYGSVLMEMIRLFMSVRSYGVVADWLNTGGIPTTQDIARIRAGRGEGNTRLEGDKAKPRGAKWMASAVKAILTSRSVLGECVRSDGTVVRHTDGSPVLMGEPVLTDIEWLQLQEVVQQVQVTQSPRRPSPVRGFLFCDGPGVEVASHALFWTKGGDGTARTRSKTARIRCSGRPARGLKPCSGHSWPADEVYGLIEAAFKFQVGHVTVRERRTVADDSRAAQVALLDGRMSQLESEFKVGRISAAVYAAHLGEVAAEREELTSQPAARPLEKWITVQRHRDGCRGGPCTCPALTYADWWDASTPEERREKLLLWGVKVYAGTGGVRFEYGDNFPTTVRVTELRFDGSHARPGRNAVSIVLDLEARVAELMTHTGQVTTLPLPLGTQAIALAA
ncbi:recombinase family protein [Streptomyces luteireticuli]|uniref:recombinase family protein n=1 Tax=Streptomyces luteireticuli TaxID=173858 RepID=UPI0035585C34